MDGCNFYFFKEAEGIGRISAIYFLKKITSFANLAGENNFTYRRRCHQPITLLFALTPFFNAQQSTVDSFTKKKK